MSEKFILYGAGKVGKRCYEFLKSKNMDNLLYAFCDQNYENISNIGHKAVESYDKLKLTEYPFIVAVGDERYKKEILEKLKSDNKVFYIDFLEWINAYFEDAVERDRNIIAYCHIDNSYFKDVDNEEDLNIFWANNSIFYNMFKKLDLENVIELACGEGRHVKKYVNKAGNITLVDILDKNIKVCQERYKDCNNIRYYCNDGYDLKELKDNSYTALFTYDAMVHFEMMDIYSYLKDIYRVLKPNGMALFHHSNNGEDYRNNFLSNKHCRNFMSKEIFAYLAYKCGFEIVEQYIIDWGKGENLVKSLDCVTLVRKNVSKPYNKRYDN